MAMAALRYSSVLGLGAAAVLVAAFGSHAKMRDEPAARTDCMPLSVACADTVTPTIAADGRLWVAARAGNSIFVASSEDGGRSFAAPVTIDTGGAKLDWGPDARPAIVVDRDDRIVVAYAIFRNDNFDGEVLFTRSADRGLSFSKPQPITQVQESQRFVSLALDDDGAIFAAWLDKRDRVKAQAEGRRFAGAGLAFAWSRDGGQSYDHTTLAFDDTCECCRLGIGFAGHGRPVVLFRNIFDGKVRDHAVVTFDNPSTPGEVRRVSTDNWVIDACPHHGPSLAIGPDGTYHAAWFTQGNARKGLFYASSKNQGRDFTAPMQLGEPGHLVSRPYILAQGNAAYLAWKEFDGSVTKVMLRMSPDAGATWSAAFAVAETRDNSDHPILAGGGHGVFLSWQTKAEGYRLIKLEQPS